LGGKPTVRELLSSLVFNPVDGTIRLNGERIMMQRAAVGSELRRELISLLGPHETRVFLIRLGFMSGRADARFIRSRWPSLDIGDAFTAGTRLHTFSGIVRVETVYNEFDFRTSRQRSFAVITGRPQNRSAGLSWGTPPVTPANSSTR
jgi:hypothetical protein